MGFKNGLKERSSFLLRMRVERKNRFVSISVGEKMTKLGRMQRKDACWCLH